jgi:hypothetical protein
LAPEVSFTPLGVPEKEGGLKSAGVIPDSVECLGVVGHQAGLLDGLLDEHRPGTPRKLSDGHVERVLTRTLESQPEAAKHWSTR